MGSVLILPDNFKLIGSTHLFASISCIRSTCRCERLPTAFSEWFRSSSCPACRGPCVCWVWMNACRVARHSERNMSLCTDGSAASRAEFERGRRLRRFRRAAEVDRGAVCWCWCWTNGFVKTGGKQTSLGWSSPSVSAFTTRERLAADDAATTEDPPPSPPPLEGWNVVVVVVDAERRSTSQQPPQSTIVFMIQRGGGEAGGGERPTAVMITTTASAAAVVVVLAVTDQGGW